MGRIELGDGVDGGATVVDGRLLPTQEIPSGVPLRRAGAG